MFSSLLLGVLLSVSVATVVVPASAASSCVVSDWGAWSPCSRLTQTQYRARVIDDPAGGYPCATQTETQRCVIDCLLSEWTATQACNATTGLQNQIKTVIRKPSTSGARCLNPLPSRVFNCPVNCSQSVYVDSGECDVATGLLLQSRSVIVAPLNGGLACEKPTQTRTCAVACVTTDWIGSGECDPATGLKPEARSVVIAPLNGGTECGALVRDTICSVACLLGNFTANGACDPVQRTQPQARSVIVAPLNGGEPCGVTSQEVPCVPLAALLPINCVQSEWSNIDICNPYSGQQYQTRTTVTAAANGGAACGEGGRHVNCLVNCQVGGWYDASGCYSRCFFCSYRVNQRRNIVFHPRNGGEPCPSLTRLVGC